MKRILISLTLITFTLLFFSCKKEKNEEPSSFYISWKMDDIQKEFMVYPAAVKDSVDGVISIIFDAYQDKISNEFIYIKISQRGKQIGTGTYISPGPDSNDFVVEAFYMPAIYDSAKTFGAGFQEHDTPKLTVTITSISDKNVTGSFSGTFYNNGGYGTLTSSFTEGKFNLPIN